MHPIIASTRQHPVYQLKQQLAETDLSSMYHRVFSREEIRGSERLSMFGSNNYLGLAHHPDVIAASRAATEALGSATTGSRLLNGTYDLHADLDTSIARLVGTESALSFPSGYQANVGTIAALLRRGNTAVVDEYVHASVLDGVKMSGAQLKKFRHNDVDDLRETLRTTDDGAGTLIIVDSVYSMEGSLAPLADICQTARDFGAAVMVDEAHGIGVFGPGGSGWVAECGVADEVDVLMGSLSKAVASTGGFIAGSEELIDVLRYTARALMFSTSATPATAAAAGASIGIIGSDEGEGLRGDVIHQSTYLRTALSKAFGTEHADYAGREVTPITPFKIGDSLRAASISRSLIGAGTYVGAALYPAVPEDGAILRLCVTAGTTTDEIDKLVDDLGELVGAP